MKSFRKSYKTNDELYTPPCLVNLLVPFIKDYQINNKKSLLIWCPFDTKDSEFVKILSKIDNIKIIYSHIWNDQDFFNYLPDNFNQVDIIISNPPFSLKKKVFERLFILNKPFVMLMNLMALNYQEIGELFLDKGIQLLIPDKKVSFNGKTSSFNSSYVCHKFLNNDLKFVHLPNNNTGNNFIGSSMIKNSNIKEHF